MEAIADKRDIINQLRKQIISLEGLNSEALSRQLDFGLGPMNQAFPSGVFPLGNIHEFVSPTEAHAAATKGFITNLLRTLCGKNGICLWIGINRNLFPPAQKFFGIEPDRIIFVDVKLRKDGLWVMEQALKCKALSAVVAELRELSFAESRRLQLAVENSQVTGFIHRQQPASKHPLACVSRWQISPLPSNSNGLPGIGRPRVLVELEKIRNGHPGSWKFEWQNGRFYALPDKQTKMRPVISIANNRSYA